MILAVDVHYLKNSAVAAGLLFQNWTDANAISERVILVSAIARYQPGKFYRRELPCIMLLLEELEALPDYIIIDGHVYLDEAGQPGLGKYLYDALHGKAVVIGVAKTRFKSTPSNAAVYSACSKRALYVTAAGLNQADAKKLILQMHGCHRLPTLLKQVDQLSRRPHRLSDADEKGWM